MLLALTSNVDVTCIDLKCWCYLHWLLMLMLLALTSNVDVTCIANVDVTCIQRLMVTCIDF